MVLTAISTASSTLPVWLKIVDVLCERSPGGEPEKERSVEGAELERAL